MRCRKSTSVATPRGPQGHEARRISSLLGVGVGLILVRAFVVPASLRHGKSPFVVAPVGSSAAMFATIVLAHGIGAKSLTALSERRRAC